VAKSTLVSVYGVLFVNFEYDFCACIDSLLLMGVRVRLYTNCVILSQRYIINKSHASERTVYR
jgi:hypothetical protein